MNLDPTLAYTAVLEAAPGLDMREARPLIDQLAALMTAANPADRWAFARAWLAPKLASPDNTCARDLVDFPDHPVRYHGNYGHGLKPGHLMDINCPHCKAEEAERHDHPRGPVCAVMERYTWDADGTDDGPMPCGHGSCGAIVEAHCWACMVEAEPTEANPYGWVTCRTHGYVFMTDSGSGEGFAGGRVWHATLACGCYLMDESDDLRAAR